MKRLILATLLASGCQPQHLNEPVRSNFYMMCMVGAGWPVSGCDCLEQAAFDNGAPTYVAPGDNVAGAKFSESANKGTLECRKATEEKVKEGMLPAGETSTDGKSPASDHRGKL